MSTTQVRITIPVHLKKMLKVQASRYGVTVASYIRQLILEEIRKQESYPLRTPSKATLRAIKQAEKEYKEGKTIKIPADQLRAYFEKL